MKQLQMIALLLVGIALLVGCDKSADDLAGEDVLDEDKVLVRINGRPITEYDLTYWLRGAHGQEITPEMKENTLERLVDGELVYQKGRELGLHRNESYRKEIRKLALQLRATQRAEMMQRVYNQEVVGTIEVSPEEVRQYFEDNRGRLERRLHLGTLRFHTVAEARAALERARAGESFEDLAGLSQDSQWETGLLPWSKIPLEWHDEVYQLEPGQVSDVFEGERTGIRLFKLLDSEKADSVEFKSVQNSIMNRLQDARARDAFKKYLADLREAAHIERQDRF